MENQRIHQTLEEIDQLLDKLDLLVNQLPLPNGVKREICSNFYDVWLQVESAAEAHLVEFGE